MLYKVNRTLFISFLMVLASFGTGYAVPNDSLKTVSEDGQQFVVHKVEKGNTLFSLSQRYGCTVDAIRQANPGVAANGLAVGSRIKIPYSKKEGGEKSSGSQKGNTKYHKVEAGQTLYSISRKYDVKVKDIRKWNDLEGNNLEVGQKLVVRRVPGQTAETAGKNTGKKASGDAKQDEQTDKSSSVDTSANRPQKRISKTKTLSGYNKVVEVGMAQTFSPEESSGKYEALHPSASVGNILEVKNRETGEKVFVRVVGQLEGKPANKDLVVKISKAAQEKIDMKGDEFKVEVSYIP